MQLSVHTQHGGGLHHSWVYTTCRQHQHALTPLRSPLLLCGINRAQAVLGYVLLLLWVGILSVAVGVYDLTLVQVGMMADTHKLAPQTRVHVYLKLCLAWSLMVFWRCSHEPCCLRSSGCCAVPCHAALSCTVAVLRVQWYGWPMLSVSAVLTLFQVNTFALTLMLVFKQNASYAR